MTKRLVPAVAAGSIVVFLVSSIWHMASGLGQVGIKPLPNEDGVLSAMRSSIRSSGLYFFPEMEPEAKGSNRHSSQAAYLEKYKLGPTGILVYHPGGEELAFGKLLAVQFLTGVVGALLLAVVLAMAADGTSFGKRAIIVSAIAVFAAVIYEIPYWNWYGFPVDYILAHAAGWIVSWSAAGLSMAAILKRETVAQTH
jgi:hypothetical protein